MIVDFMSFALAEYVNINNAIEIPIAKKKNHGVKRSLQKIRFVSDHVQDKAHVKNALHMICVTSAIKKFVY